MRSPQFYSAPEALDDPPRRGLLIDLLVLAVLLTGMVAIKASAPSNTYCYAQLWQIQPSIDHLHGGSLVLPRIDLATDEVTGDYNNYARKPQLYAWLLTATMKLTGANNEFVYRVPTILAAFGLAVLTCLLGRRWFGRRAGLFAGCLLLTCLRMNKLTYLATTDMLLACLVTLCIFCADRLTFHPARQRRWAWQLGFWVAMILAALTKGWGLVNLALVGGFLALAGGCGPGFAATRTVEGSNKALLVGALLLRRWWAVARRVKLLWGLLALAAVIVPLWIAMLNIGGPYFQSRMYFEIVQRITGAGEHPPHTASGPALLHLYYHTMPMSLFAGCALFFVPVRRWLSRRSPIGLPLWWIVTVLVAFAIPAGYRPDYLLPCYPAVALLAGWVCVELVKPARWNSQAGKHLRRIIQATPFVIAAGCIGIPLLYLFGAGRWDWLIAPAWPTSLTWDALAVLPTVGFALVGLSVWAVRRRSMKLLVAATCVGMMGVLFCNGHLFSRQARYGDGQVTQRFAQAASPLVGQDDYMVYFAQKMGFPAYHGSFGRIPTGRGEQALIGAPERWLITTDCGLLYLGAYREIPKGRYVIKIDGKKRRFQPRPQDLGLVYVQSIAPLRFNDRGSLYLIELDADRKPTSPPLETGYLHDSAR